MDNEQPSTATTPTLQTDLDAVRSASIIDPEEIVLTKPDAEGEPAESRPTEKGQEDDLKTDEEDDVIDFKPSEESDEKTDDEDDDSSTIDADKYPFDEKVLEGLTEEQANAIRKRWQEGAQGLIKREKQLEQEKQEFEANKEEYQTYRSWIDDFSNPQTAAQTCVNMLNQVAEAHKVSMDQLLEAMGIPLPDSESSADPNSTTAKPRPQDQSDIQALIRQAVAEAVKPLQEQIAEQKKKEESQSWIKTETNNVNAYFKQFGIRFSEKQIQEAVDNVPSLKDQPRKAVEKWFGADIERLKASRKVKTDNRPKPSPLNRASAPVEEGPYDPSDLSMEEIAHRAVSKNAQRSS